VPPKPERRKKRDEGGFATPCTLRQRQHAASFASGHAKSHTRNGKVRPQEIASSAVSTRKVNMDQRSGYPAGNEIERTTLYRSKRLPQTRQSSPQLQEPRVIATR